MQRYFVILVDNPQKTNECLGFIPHSVLELGPEGREVTVQSVEYKGPLPTSAQESGAGVIPRRFPY